MTPTKALHTSVPPDIEPIWAVDDTASCTQRNPSAGSGAPVEPMPRSRERSTDAPGVRPSLRQAIRNGAEVP